SCKAIPRKSVSYKEIIELAENILSLKKESVNAVFYDDAVPKNNFVMICSSKLEKAIVDFINDILLERNQVTFIAWPVWIVSTYFQNFPLDREKFRCALFSIEREEICEIIAYTNNGIICYRNGDIKRSEKETEIENTIKYIKKTHGILPEDVVIYLIDDSVIENLLKRSTNNMGIIGNNIDTSLLKYKNHINKIIKIAFSLFCLFFICKCCFGILDIFNLNKQIAACNSVINSLDKEVLSELSLWNDIDYSFINYPDFKDLLRQKIKTDRIGKIQNATITFDEESKEILTKLIPLEN
ncbi:MAG: hypothetical protein LBU35_01140, partial [Holosporales bacterium]|nr:hypothetical protein [Holosporales bacterium]